MPNPAVRDRVLQQLQAGVIDSAMARKVLQLDGYSPAQVQSIIGGSFESQRTSDRALENQDIQAQRQPRQISSGAAIGRQVGGGPIASQTANPYEAQLLRARQQFPGLNSYWASAFLEQLKQFNGDYDKALAGFMGLSNNPFSPGTQTPGAPTPVVSPSLPTPTPVPVPPPDTTIPGGIDDLLPGSLTPELSVGEEIQRQINQMFGTQLNPAVRRGIGRTTGNIPDLFRLYNAQRLASGATDEPFSASQFASSQLGGNPAMSARNIGSSLVDLIGSNAPGLEGLLTNQRADTLSGFFGPSSSLAGLGYSQRVSPTFRSSVDESIQQRIQNLLLGNPGRFNTVDDILRGIQGAGII